MSQANGAAAAMKAIAEPIYCSEHSETPARDEKRPDQHHVCNRCDPEGEVAANCDGKHGTPHPGKQLHDHVGCRQ